MNTLNSESCDWLAIRITIIDVVMLLVGIKNGPYTVIDRLVSAEIDFWNSQLPPQPPRNIKSIWLKKVFFKLFSVFNILYFIFLSLLWTKSVSAVLGIPMEIPLYIFCVYSIIYPSSVRINKPASKYIRTTEDNIKNACFNCCFSCTEKLFSQ